MAGIERARPFRQFGIDGIKQAKFLQKRLLHFAARAQHDPRRADIRGFGQHIGGRKRGRQFLGIVNDMTADLEPVADGNLFVELDRAIFERHGEGENLEHRSQLIDILRHAVAARIGAVFAAIFAVRQRDHGENFTRVHIHHDAACGTRTKFLSAFFGLLRQRILHAHVERQFHALARMAVFEPRIEAAFETGDPRAVMIGNADHLHRGAALGIITLVGRLELKAGKAKSHHLAFGGGRNLTLHQHIAVFGREDAMQPPDARARRFGKRFGRARLVGEGRRLRVKIVNRKIARQKLAIAVEHVGAQRKCVRGPGGLRTGNPAVQEHDVDQAYAHKRKRHHTDGRGDSDPPLNDGGRLRHIHGRQFPERAEAKRMGASRRRGGRVSGTVTLASRIRASPSGAALPRRGKSSSEDSSTVGVSLSPSSACASC